MSDLPQATAQLENLEKVFGSSPGFNEKYFLDWKTPYMGVVIISVIFLGLCGVGLTIKFVVGLSVIMLPISLLVLFKKTSGDPWWSLIGFPLAFGLNFLYGHLVFIITIPFGILLLRIFLNFLDKNQKPRKIIFIILLGALYFMHIYVFGIIIFLMGLLILASDLNMGDKLNRLWPIALVSVLPIVWLFLNRDENNFHGASVWGIGLNRITEFSSILYSVEGDRKISLIGWVLLSVLFLGANPLRGRAWVPVAGIFIMYLMFPFRYLNVAHYVYHRLAIFLLITCLMVTSSTQYLIRKIVARIGIASIVLILLLMNCSRFHKFNQEASNFKEILSEIAPNKKTLALIYNARSMYVPGWPYRHFGSYAECEKNSLMGYSFSMHPPQFVRLKKSFWPTTLMHARHLHYAPENFNWKRDGNFDYFMLRSTNEKSQEFKNLLNDKVKLLKQYKDWSLYGRIEIST